MTDDGKGIIRQRAEFDSGRRIYESALLNFHGVEGFDVYNCSIPFRHGGKDYIYGRVERRGDWARSWVRLFENTGRDDWTLVPGSMIYQLEDPYAAQIKGSFVLGGTHVQYAAGEMADFFGYFYRGSDIGDLSYFATGPVNMKDIRLVEIKTGPHEGKIGVFSRPRGEEIRKKYGSESMIGFTVIDSLDGLTAGVIANAPPIGGLFDDNQWGGCNQCRPLESGGIGVIGHKSYRDGDLLVYMNISFVFDYEKNIAKDMKIIGTRDCYPAAPSKKPELADCAFTSGIVARADGKVDLYSGIGDAYEGRIVIDDPFAAYGKILA
ncbi:MAG: DUF1861 family protein [Defluviitaleaceae bacterium]|nr:DUF1861 family protein [Defluviitaleaceae bacterium]